MEVAKADSVGVDMALKHQRRGASLDKHALTGHDRQVNLSDCVLKMSNIEHFPTVEGFIVSR